MAEPKNLTMSAEFEAELAEARQRFSDLLLSADNRGPAPRLEEVLDITWPDVDFSRFRFQHVEVLIDQAADLLDRGMRDREAWCELQEKRFNLAIALEEFTRQDEIQREEEDLGHDAKMAAKSQAEARAIENEKTELTRAAEKIATSRTHLEASTAERIKISMWNFWVTLYNRNFETIGNFDLPIQPYAGHALPQIYNIAPTLGQRAGAYEVTDRAEYLEFAGAVANANKERVTGQSDAVHLQAEFDEAEVNFQRRKRQAMRDIQASKLAAWKNDGGELNYQERMKPIEMRFRNDFTEALSRLLVAAKGLKEIYGYEESLPSPRISYQLFDECLIWVRRAIHFVTAFNRTEQICFAPISLRQAVGEADWEAGKQQTHPTWTLNLVETGGQPNCLFGNLNLEPCPRYIRLRGAAVYVESAKACTWRVLASAPRTSFVMWNKDNVKHQLDQSKVPPLLALKARSRQSTFQTELVGTTHLHNVAPFGNWVVALDARSVEGLSVSEVEDIVIDFYVISQLTP